MKRMHIGMRVDDIDVAVDFYNKLFGALTTSAARGESYSFSTFQVDGSTMLPRCT